MKSILSIILTFSLLIYPFSDMASATETDSVSFVSMTDDDEIQMADTSVVADDNQPSTLRNHLGYRLEVNPCWLPKMGSTLKTLIKDNYATSIGIQARYNTLTTDNDDFATDYGYPVLSLGLTWNIYNKVTLHRPPSHYWPLIEEVEYDSRLGNIISLYGGFNRAFYRSQHFELSYFLNAGIGYCRHPYNTYNNIDNELIGGKMLIYFGMGIGATYMIDNNWGLYCGLSYNHHSNGAMNRPNKGSNAIGPSVGVVYHPDYALAVKKHGNSTSKDFEKSLYLNLGFGIGGKTLFEDWRKTQFHTSPSESDYRTDKFKLYAAYSLQADLMYRFARRWASGIGVDLFYGTYSDHIAELDKEEGWKDSHSPFSMGLALKHEAFYHQFSLSMELGYYLYRKMGHWATNSEEKKYYERIGFNYSFKSLSSLKLGVNVKAHALKADYTEMTVGIPIILMRR